MSTDQVLQVPVLWKAATFENFVALFEKNYALFEKIYALFEKIYALFEKIYALFEKIYALFEKIYAPFEKPEAALLRQPFWMNQYLQPTLGSGRPARGEAPRPQPWRARAPAFPGKAVK